MTRKSRPVKIPYFLYERAKKKQQQLIVERQDFVPLWEGIVNLDDVDKKRGKNRFGGFQL